MEPIVINPATYVVKEWSWDKVKAAGTGIYFFGNAWKESLGKYLVVIFPKHSLQITSVPFIAYPHMPYRLEQADDMPGYTYKAYEYNNGFLWKLFSGEISMGTFVSSLTPKK